MDVKTLTELALKKSGDTSIRAFAKRLGVSHVTVLAWLDATRYPSFEHAAHLAGLAELPIIETASNIRMQCPSNTNKKRSILKQIANTTATLLIGAGITCPSPSQAQPISKNFSNKESDIVGIMRSGRKKKKKQNTLHVQKNGKKMMEETRAAAPLRSTSLTHLKKKVLRSKFDNDEK
ncbi:DUF3693 domain-containing protein [Xylella fastidiosa subsp. multiplex]|uniref:DUF3693 domain-containing protein n=1 Tax=Xylella fastidiosa subsp. multiplex TaxID=644357 RepID=A0AAW6HVS4_XYLFS|nr:DUF3693 domain-containing protein [Xylella fastidiosa]MDC6408534.1 DUF3693 domain-containing protein [Xylella fastidiosa subsp. multiplex]MDD0936737.1 DUF3693 domain-containing protein [Xylella fastidiosa subsp. multiplex]